jgi:MFS family permease
MSLSGFAVAIIGAYIAFLPLLQILLPIKAAEIEPANATAVLGMVAASGAVVAGIANFVIGWLSDRTRSYFSGRRPWIIAGLFGIAASDAAIWQAHSLPALLIAFGLFQLAFNMMFSPLLALVSDRVAPARRGLVSALVGLGHPVGAVVGTVVVGSLFVREGDRFLALAAMVLIAILPLAIRLGADPAAAPPAAERAADRPGRGLSCNFALAWLSRACIVMTFTVSQLYLLFYLRAMIPQAPLLAVEHGVTLLAVVFGSVSAVSGIVAGRISDRTGRRRPFVLGSALAICVAMMALAVAPSWPLAIAAYAVFAAGAGTHTAVEFAMIVDILPSRDRVARDLGILNLSNIMPQIIAPLAVTWIVTLPGATIQWAFGAAAIAAAAGAVLVALMRAVR